MIRWLVVLRINVDLAIFQPYLDLEAGDNQSLKIQVARPGIEPRSSCSASQELNHSATAAPSMIRNKVVWDKHYYSNRLTMLTVRNIFLFCYSRFRLMCIFIFFKYPDAWNKTISNFAALADYQFFHFFLRLTFLPLSHFKHRGTSVASEEILTRPVKVPITLLVRVQRFRKDLNNAVKGPSTRRFRPTIISR